MEIIHHLFPERILYALGWTVVHSLWQGFVVALALAAFLIGWQKKSARLRCRAASLALCITSALAVLTFYYLYQNAVDFPADLVSKNGEVLGRYYLKDESGWLTQYFNEHLPLIVTAWLVGLVFFILKMLGGLVHVQRLKNCCLSPAPREWNEMLGALAGELGMERHIKLAESALARVPMVVGWLKPVILMPIGAVNHLSPAQVEAILAHELAHIHRCDYLLNLLQSLVEIVFYFNPAVWWMSANIRTERENSCDDLAVQLCGNSLAYAKALVSLQEMQMPRAVGTPSLALSFSKNRGQLLQRIQRILQPPQNKSNVMEKFTATFLLLAAVLMLSVQANTPFGRLLDRTIISNEPADETEILLDSNGDTYQVTIENDTVPEAKKGETRQWSFRRSGGDDDIEIHFENDEIKSLKIDGQEIPKERYGEYEHLANELMQDLEDVPEAPVPPMPPAFSDDFAPPAMPSMPRFEMPPMPPDAPAPPRVITERNGKTTTIFIETQPGEKPVKIKMKDGKKGYVIVDGQKIKNAKGKRVVIQKMDGGEPAIAYWNDDRAWENAAFEMAELAELDASIPVFDASAMAAMEAEIAEFNSQLSALSPAADLSPEARAKWEAEQDEWHREMEVRLGESTLTKEWMERFNEQMGDHTKAFEIDGELMEENARAMMEQSQLLREQSQEMQQQHEQMREHSKDYRRQLEKERQAKAKARKELMKYRNAN